MGTRALIALQETDGAYTTIYTHWDGYPSHHGAILTEAYATEERVRALLALGDLSTLGRELGEKHAFEDRTERTRNWCTSYSRDRGEDDTAAKLYAGPDELAQAATDCWAEYVYVFAPSTGWLFMETGEDDSALLPLAPADIAKEH